MTNEPPSQSARTAPAPLQACAAAVAGVAAAASIDAAAEAAPPLGRIGPYELKVALSHDGVGQVYKAWDSNQNIDVMLTLLDLESDARDHEVIIAQLQQSVLAASRLQHAGLARIHDAGVVGAGVYIVNLWLPGRTLAQAQWAGWQPTARVAAQMVHDLAQALAHAHAHGVLHGGLNPCTVMLDSEDRPTALGLGFACTAHASDLPSMDPLVSGAAPYLAPEQLQGGAVDVRTDVHALGVLLYELLAGHRAYPGETVPEVARALMTHDPAPPHWLRLDVPERLSAIAMQALQRNPAARYAHAREVATALQAWLQQSEHETDDARVAFVAAQAAPKPVRRPPYWAAASLLLVAGLALALALTWIDRQNIEATGTVQNAADGVAEPATATIAVNADNGAVAATPVAGGDGGAVALGQSPQTPATVPGTALAASAADAPVQSPEQAARHPAAFAPALKTEPVAVAAQTAPSPQTVQTVQAVPPLPTAAVTAQAQPQAPFWAQAHAATGSRPATQPSTPPRLLPSTPKSVARDKLRPAPDRRAPVAPAVLQTGTVQLAVSPWGYVEVGGKLAGASPPLHTLTLPEGSHTITIRNEDFAPFVTTIQVTADKAATVRHRFAQ